MPITYCELSRLFVRRRAIKLILFTFFVFLNITHIQSANITKERLTYSFNEININAFILKPQNEAANKLVFLIPGESGSVSQWIELAELLTSNGYYVWIPEYPGNTLFEKNYFSTTIQQSVNYMVSEVLNTDSLKRFDKAIWGFSLASNLAVKLAVDFEKYFSVVVLDSPATSFRDVAVNNAKKYKWAIKYLTPSPYPAIENIVLLKKMKLLVIHNREDSIIPFWMGELLFDEAKCPKYIWETYSKHGESIKTNTKKYLSYFDMIFKN